MLDADIKKYADADAHICGILCFYGMHGKSMRWMILITKWDRRAKIVQY